MIRAITKSDIPDLARAYVASFHEVDPSEEWTVAQAIKVFYYFVVRWYGVTKAATQGTGVHPESG